MALLEVENLKVYFPQRGSWFKPPRFLRAVDGVSFEVKAGETVGLVGESGCGKSTLGRAIVQLEKPCAGTIRLNGEDLVQLPPRRLRAMRHRLQMIFQDPYGALNPRLTIFAALDEVLSLHTKLDRRGRLERAAELLEQVGLPAAALNRFPHQFSGGQRQRIGIARALAAEPEIIVADEPVSALDVSVQAAIVNLLEDIQAKLGTAFLFIAHDLAVVEHISRRILVMYLGRIVESAPAEELVNSPRHYYTQALLSAVPTLERGGKKRIILPGDVPSPLNPPAGCPFHNRCPGARPECRTQVPETRELSPGHFCCCHFPLDI